ncbi:MAG: nucleotidyltransferase domain-containing protein [Pseudomonadota bacterium]
MAQKKNIKEIVDRFASLLAKEIHLQEIILFGSYASGRAHKDSDIDLAVVSPDFGQRNEMEEMTYLLKRAHEIDLDIEAHPFNPRELKSPHKSSFAYEILRNGKVMYKRAA